MEAGTISLSSCSEGGVTLKALALNWMDAGDFGSKLAIALISALTVYTTTEKVKARYKVVQLTKRNYSRYYHQFAELYCDRIDPEQQIAPGVIAEHAMDSRTAPRSKRELRALNRNSDRYPTAHQLFLAVRQGRVIGLLCVLINLRRSYLMVAYLAVKKEDGIPGDVVARLLRKAQVRIAGVLGRELYVFEVSPPISQAAASRAKFRLFAEYGRNLDLVTSRVPLVYVQPDMDPDSLDGATEAIADLFIMGPEHVVAQFDQDSYLNLVKSIYFDIYLRSFPALEIQPEYLEYLNSLYDVIRSDNGR